MATPPGFVAAYSSAYNTSGTSRAIASVPMVVDEVFVVTAVMEGYDLGQNRYITGISNSGTALTWSQPQVIAISSYCNVVIWTATATASQTVTITVTANNGANAMYWGATVTRWEGSDGIGASSKTNTTGAPSLGLTTTQPNSAIVGVNGDWNAVDGGTNGASITWRQVNSANPSLRLYFRDGTRYTTETFTYADAGAAGAKTLGMTAPAGQQYAIAAVEVLGSSGSGQSATVNPATETDAAQPVARRKTRTAGTPTETDTAQPVARRKTRAITAATETDAAQPVARRKTRTVNPAIESDAAQPVARRKTRAITAALEADAAQPVARRKTRVVGTALETDEAQPITPPLQVRVATETDTAMPLGRLKTRAITPATDTEVAQPIARRKTRAINPALEADAAQPVTRRKTKTVTAATEADAAQPVTRRKLRLVTAATEADAAQPLSRRKARALGVALETDSALPIVEEGSQALAVSPAAETDQALPINRRKTRAIGPAIETDAAVPLVRVRARTVLPAAETDVSRPIGRRKGYAVGTALETDLALPVVHVGLIVLPVGTALETDSARPIGRVKTRSIGVATETDGALALARLKTRLVGTALETDVARPVLQWVPESGISWREILVQRRITHWFIRGDPITLTLVPRTRVQTSTGGFQWLELAPRAPQIMQLIEPPTPSDPVITADGQQREVHFILLGEWDATIGMYDVFEALDCQWEVIQIYHNNGYERRAAVARYG